MIRVEDLTFLENYVFMFLDFLSILSYIIPVSIHRLIVKVKDRGNYQSAINRYLMTDNSVSSHYQVRKHLICFGSRTKSRSIRSNADALESTRR